jgi:hypothetical protein
MHSRFSPSSLKRISECPPSFHSSYNIESEWAAEGTHFAEVAEQFAKGQMALEDAPEEFQGYLAEYDRILDELGLTLSSKVHVEEYLGSPEDGGTPDLCGVTIPYQDNIGVVFDIKFGMGVEVEAEGNLQLLSYAKELLAVYPELETFKLVIWQPRGFGETLKTWEVGKAEVKHFAEVELPEIKRRVLESDGGFKEGDHCQFCPRILSCPMKMEPTNDLITSTDGKNVVELDKEAVYSIVQNASRIAAVLRDAKALVKQQLLSGEITPGDCGMKIVSSLGNRKWADDSERGLKRKFGVNAVEVKNRRSPPQLEKHLRAEGALDDNAAAYIADKVTRVEGTSMVSINKKGDHIIPSREAFTDYIEE